MNQKEQLTVYLLIIVSSMVIIKANNYEYIVRTKIENVMKISEWLRNVIYAK